MQWRRTKSSCRCANQQLWDGCTTNASDARHPTPVQTGSFGTGVCRAGWWRQLGRKHLNTALSGSYSRCRAVYNTLPRLTPTTRPPAPLQARSPVFRALLTGPMREGHQSSIDIQDVRAPVFRALLYFAYTDSLPDDLQVMSCRRAGRPPPPSVGLGWVVWLGSGWVVRLLGA